MTFARSGQVDGGKPGFQAGMGAGLNVIVEFVFQADDGADHGEKGKFSLVGDTLFAAVEIRRRDEGLKIPVR